MAKLDSYLARKSSVLAERRTDFQNTPEKAVITLTASSKVAGITGARPTKMGESVMVTDAAPGLAGHALGPTAPEMLLGAVASCLVHTYLIQAALMNVPLDHIEIEIMGKLDMAGVVGLAYDKPPRLQDITYTAHVESPASGDDLRRLHEEVEMTCPVLNTIRYPVEIQRNSES
ncbi:MAG: hypothetical protein BroJett018_10240 [Chloroflexota bacterium]|nr:OsmC family peroxiredoxin [Chloroflexota bacterium]NOG62562.1 OsmC family protein [Chloroflexota bacterium]GIK63230.1 MAG: hypothetical protein BroJett018_10240 [Chloroflexota bacterium]